MLDALSSAPARVEIQDRRSGTAKTVTLSRDLAAEAIRYMMYDPSSAAQLPRRAASGLARQLPGRWRNGRSSPAGDGAPAGSNGLYLSVTRAEDVPWIAPGEGERAGRWHISQTIGFAAACRLLLWPRGKIPAGYDRPVHGKTPVLIASGAWDPVTPPSDGSEVAKSLSRSLTSSSRHGGHGFEGLEGVECLDKLPAEFVDRGPHGTRHRLRGTHQAKGIRAHAGAGRAMMEVRSPSRPPKARPTAVGNARFEEVGGNVRSPMSK